MKQFYRWTTFHRHHAITLFMMNLDVLVVPMNNIHIRIPQRRNRRIIHRIHTPDQKGHRIQRPRNVAVKVDPVAVIHMTHLEPQQLAVDQVDIATVQQHLDACHMEPHSDTTPIKAKTMKSVARK